jgi:hypothetical protein
VSRGGHLCRVPPGNRRERLDRRAVPDLAARVLLRRAGYDETFIQEVARVMEYTDAYELRKADIERAPEPVETGTAR